MRHNPTEIIKSRRLLHFFLLLLTSASMILAANAVMTYRKNVDFAADAASPEIISDVRSALVTALYENMLDENQYRISESQVQGYQTSQTLTVDIPEDVSATVLQLSLHNILASHGGRLFEGRQSADQRTVTLTAGFEDDLSVRIILRRRPGWRSFRPRIAIVVDDLGIKDPSLARRLCAIGHTITLSILPFQPHSSTVMEIAQSSGIPFILHMPMEPLSGNANPGEGAIFASDNEISIRRKLDRAFRSIKNVEGLNNHMGSRATEDIRTMEYVAKYLKENGKFFVDSRTTDRSVVWDAALKHGIKAVQMTGFLDVVDEIDAIEARFEELAEEAIRRGWAVIICHDRQNTVEVLERKIPELASRGIRFVSVDELVR